MTDSKTLNHTEWECKYRVVVHEMGTFFPQFPLLGEDVAPARLLLAPLLGC